MGMMPPPSAELVLIATMVEAFLMELPTKRRARFLKRVCENIETLGVIGSKVRRIRDPSEDAATAKAVAEAAEWYRRAIPRPLDKF